jgi:hypothetical protein
MSIRYPNSPLEHLLYSCEVKQCNCATCRCPSKLTPNHRRAAQLAAAWFEGGIRDESEARLALRGAIRQLQQQLQNEDLWDKVEEIAVAALKSHVWWENHEEAQMAAAA